MIHEHILNSQTFFKLMKVYQIREEVFNFVNNFQIYENFLNLQTIFWTMNNFWIDGLFKIHEYFWIHDTSNLQKNN